MHIRQRGRGGFTLVELSVVLVIIALLAGGSLAMFLAALNGLSYSRTNDKLDTIQEMLLDFVKANGYLPCPADITQSPSSSATYGIGTGTGNATPNCSAANFSQGNTVAGLLPVRTLSMDDSYALDGFGRPFLYVMDSRLSVANAATLYPLGSNVGSITIKDDAGGTRTTSAIYTLISFGEDGHGAFSANGGMERRDVHATNVNELQNCHCDTNANPTAFDSTFVQMKESGDIAQNVSNFFDHTVRYAELFDFTGSGTISGSSTSSAGGSSSGGGSSSSAGGSSSGGSSSGGGMLCPDRPSCTLAGHYCGSFSECCSGLQCVGNTCVACAGPPYANDCGCSVNGDCQSGYCDPVHICPGAQYCTTSSGGSSSGGAGSSSGGAGSSSGGAGSSSGGGSSGGGGTGGSSGGGSSSGGISSSSGSIPACLTSGDLCATFPTPGACNAGCTSNSFPLAYQGSQVWGSFGSSTTQCGISTDQATCTADGGTWNSGSNTCSWPNGWQLTCSGTNDWTLNMATGFGCSAGATLTSGSSSPFQLVFSATSCSFCDGFSAPVTITITQGACSR